MIAVSGVVAVSGGCVVCLCCVMEMIMGLWVQKR